MVDRIEITPTNNQPSQSFSDSISKQREIKNLRLSNIATADDQINITEPSSPTHPDYPHNKVTQTTSGHLEEVDDTPGAERLMRMHKSGTFEEIHPDGRRVTKIFGEDFYIILEDHNLVVGGVLNITVNSDANILVNGDMKTKVSGDYDLVVHGDMNVHVEGNKSEYVKGDIDIQTEQELRITSTLSTKFQINEHFYVQSSGSNYITASGTNRLYSSGRTFIDGSRVDFNLPMSKPESLDIEMKDIGAGLNVPSSVFEPSAEYIMIMRSNNIDMVDYLDESGITFPKDRKKI